MFVHNPDLPIAGWKDVSALTPTHLFGQWLLMMTCFIFFSLQFLLLDLKVRNLTELSQNS